MGQRLEIEFLTLREQTHINKDRGGFVGQNVRALPTTCAVFPGASPGRDDARPSPRRKLKDDGDRASPGDNGGTWAMARPRRFSASRVRVIAPHQMVVSCA